jgi:hypothetical protein
VFKGEVGAEHIPGVCANGELIFEGFMCSARVNTEWTKAVICGANHHPEVGDISFALCVGDSPHVVEFSALSLAAPVVVSDKALYDILVVREVKCHESLKFVFVYDGEYTLT